jgi:hypothetical protein
MHIAGWRFHRVRHIVAVHPEVTSLIPWTANEFAPKPTTLRTSASDASANSTFAA